MYIKGSDKESVYELQSNQSITLILVHWNDPIQFIWNMQTGSLPPLYNLKNIKMD